MPVKRPIQPKQISRKRQAKRRLVSSHTLKAQPIEKRRQIIESTIKRLSKTYPSAGHSYRAMLEIIRSSEKNINSIEKILASENLPEHHKQALLENVKQARATFLDAFNKFTEHTTNTVEHKELHKLDAIKFIPAEDAAQHYWNEWAKLLNSIARLGLKSSK